MKRDVPVTPEAVLRATAAALPASGAVIVCLCTSTKLPSGCSPMARSPSPRTGFVFDESFPERFAAALQANHAIHDGAVIASREKKASPYRVIGWSYRLHPPPPTKGRSITNRGSAFNSCLAMSLVRGVDAAFLITGSQVWRFERGLARRT